MKTLKNHTPLTVFWGVFTISLMMLLSSCTTDRPLASNDSGSSEGPHAAPLLDRNLFFGDPQYAGAQLSPDGEYITFRQHHQEVMNIWIKGVNEEFDQARPLTADTERPVTSYFWSHDSRYVLYVQDKGGDENYHIYRVDIHEEPAEDSEVPEAVNLTPMEGIRAQIYSVPRAYPDRIIVGINDRDASLHDAYQLDIESGEMTLLIENTDNIAGWLTDRQSNIRGGIRQTAEGGSELLMIRDEGFEQVYVAGPEESFSPLRFHEDGKRIYMSTDTGDRDLAEFILFNPETGESEIVERDPEGEVDFGGATFSEITHQILATHYVGDKRRTYFRDEEFEQIFENVRDQVGAGEIRPTSRTHDEYGWLFYVGSDLDPGSVYHYDHRSTDVSLLYQSRPDLPSEYLSEMIPIRYTARDGLEIPAYLTIPYGMEARDLPVVVVPHGGPWARDYWGYDSHAQFLANRGYAVLQINFRGSTGFGKAFLNAGNHEWGTGAMQHDITDGVQYLIDEGIADPDRIGIFGGSYGGYATLAGLAFTPDLYAAGISFVGPSNIITLLNSIPPYWGPIRKIFHTRVGDPENPEDYARMIEQSPLFSAENITAPLMVVQGANDPRVVQAESDQIVVAMRDLGREVTYLVAEDEGHGFARRVNRLAYIHAMEQFFADHLDGRYQPEIEAEYRERLEDITLDVDSVELAEESPELEAAKTVVLPRFNASKFDGTSLEYQLSMNVQGNDIQMQVKRSANLVEETDGVHLELRDEITSPMGNMTDVVRANYETFAPLQRVMEQPMSNISVSYEPEKVTGKMSAGPQEQEFEVDLEAPVFAEGIHVDFFVSHMVQSGMDAALIRYFDINTQSVRHVRAVAESGAEYVTVSFETLDNRDSARVYEVSGDGIIHTVQDVLPPQMGGGTMNMKLLP